jgi:hypothetical protein
MPADEPPFNSRCAATMQTQGRTFGCHQPDGHDGEHEDLTTGALWWFHWTAEDD